MRIELSDLQSTAAVVSIPLRHKFRGITFREALLFEGPEGWAEWSPFLEYEVAEAATWLKAAIEAAFEPTPRPVRSRIGINATLPAIGPDQVPSALANFGSFRTVKIKVGGSSSSLQDDLARIEAVSQIKPDVNMRLDANGSWSIEEALWMARSLRDRQLSIEYFEQPCSTADELVVLRARLAESELLFKIAADESIRKANDPMAIIRAEAVDLLVLKVAPLGGIAPVLEIANSTSLPIVVSSALETSIGLSRGLQGAAALPNLEMDCGLGTAALLGGDIVSEPLIPNDGWLEVRRTSPDPKLLDEFRADSNRRDWWLKRLTDAFRLIES